MQTIQYRKSREMKEDKYTKSLAKNQVCAIFHMQDIQKNVVPKFIKLCWKRHAGVPFTSRTRTLLKSAVRLRINGRNNSQHCCGNNLESCCVYVGSGVQTDATTPNIVETLLRPVVHRGKDTTLKSLKMKIISSFSFHFRSSYVIYFIYHYHS